MVDNSLSLKNFLKKYTAIPNKFIDTYYKFYDLCDNNKFGIIDNSVIKYLEIEDIKKFRRRIKDQYREGIDYVIKKEYVDSGIGKTYYLTFDCFEKICLVSRTPRGNEVRDYVQTLRKFINYYKKHFSDKINDLAKDHDYVYIILVNKGKNIFKVGITQDIRKRLYAYSTGIDKHPDIEYILIVDSPKKVEKCIKLFGEECRFKKSKELYKVNFDSLKKLAENCGIADHEFNERKKDDLDAYVVYDSNKTNSVNIKGSKKIIKKSSKASSKKIIKKGSKKIIKKGSKVSSKKISRKSK